MSIPITGVDLCEARIRNEALEEAAKVAHEMSNDYWIFMEPTTAKCVAELIAKKIRNSIDGHCYTQEQTPGTACGFCGHPEQYRCCPVRHCVTGCDGVFATDLREFKYTAPKFIPRIDADSPRVSVSTKGES